jgi:hypothetical protein
MMVRSMPDLSSQLGREPGGRPRRRTDPPISRVSVPAGPRRLSLLRAAPGLISSLLSASELGSPLSIVPLFSLSLSPWLISFLERQAS